MIDSADRERLVEAKNELHTLLKEPLLSNCVLLVYANKADLPGAVTVEEMIKALEIRTVMAEDRHWYVQPSCATTGEGLIDGLDWLSRKLNERPHRR